MTWLDKELALIGIIGTIGIIAAVVGEWPTAGACIAGGFAILKGRDTQP